MKDGELRRVLKTFYPGRGFGKNGFSVTVLIMNVKTENQSDKK